MQSNVQFWEYDPKNGTDGFTPVEPPWVRDPGPWQSYAEARARKPQRQGDTYSIARDAKASAPAEVAFVSGDATLTKLD